MLHAFGVQVKLEDRCQSKGQPRSDVDSFKAVLLEVCSAKLAGLLTPEFQFGVSVLVDCMGRILGCRQ